MVADKERWDRIMAPAIRQFEEAEAAVCASLGLPPPEPLPQPDWGDIDATDLRGPSVSGVSRDLGPRGALSWRAIRMALGRLVSHLSAARDRKHR
jgi:hypothetical protein